MPSAPILCPDPLPRSRPERPSAQNVFMEGQEKVMPRNAHPDLGHYPAAKARQGAIVLNRPWQRAVFVAGLAGCILLLIVCPLLFAGAH